MLVIEVNHPRSIAGTGKILMRFEVQTKRGGDWVIEAFHDRKDDAIYDAQKLLAGQFIKAARVVEEIHDPATDSYRTKIIFKRERSDAKSDGGPKTPDRAKSPSTGETGSEDTAAGKKEDKNRRRTPPPAKKADTATKIVRGLFAFMFLVALASTVWLENQPSDSEVLAEKAAEKKKKLAAKDSASSNTGGLTSGLSADGGSTLSEEELAKRSNATAFGSVSLPGSQDGEDEEKEGDLDVGGDSIQAFGSDRGFFSDGDSGFFSDGDNGADSGGADGAGGYGGTAGDQTAMLPPDPALAYSLDSFRLRQVRASKVFLDITLKITFELENKQAGNKMALRAAALHDALYLELSRIVTKYQARQIRYYQSPAVTDQLMAIAHKELGPGVVKRMVVTGKRRR